MENQNTNKWVWGKKGKYSEIFVSYSIIIYEYLNLETHNLLAICVQNYDHSK